MANPHRGEVELHAGDQTYTLRMSINAIVEIEDHFDLGINQVAAKLSDVAGMRLGTLRSVIRLALKEHHPDLTEEAVGEIIQAAGFAATGEAIQKAMRAAFPEAKSDGPPRKAKQDGTGKAS